MSLRTTRPNCSTMPVCPSLTTYSEPISASNTATAVATQNETFIG